jgi:hypothetical protein
VEEVIVLSKTKTVTFDSNIWEVIVLPEKLAVHPRRAELQIIRDHILSGQITPFISDVIFTLEAIRTKDRAATIRDVRLRTRKTESHSDSGLKISININADFSHHPGLNDHLRKALAAALPMGFKLIKVNRIGFPMVEAHLYKNPSEKPEPPKSHQIFQDFDEAGIGSAHAKRRGNELKSTNNLLRDRAPLLAFAESRSPEDDDLVSKIVAEWADGDSVIAHYEYDHDFFCTLDEGKSTPLASVLDSSRRPWLLQNYGIKIVSPAELVQEITKL